MFIRRNIVFNFLRSFVLSLVIFCGQGLAQQQFLSEQSLHETKILAENLLQFGGTEKTLYVLFGRSPTPVAALLSELKLPVVVIPISGLSGDNYEIAKHFNNNLDSELAKFMKLQLPAAEMFGHESSVRRVVAVDFYATGQGFFNATVLLKKAISELVPIDKIQFDAFGWTHVESDRVTNHLKQKLPVGRFKELRLGMSFPFLAKAFDRSLFDEWAPFGRLDVSEFRTQKAETILARFNGPSENFVRLRQAYKNFLIPALKRSIDSCLFQATSGF